MSQIVMAVPEASTEQARAALEDAVPIPSWGAARFLEEFAEHMAAHPDALTSGHTQCPRVLVRLIHTMHDTGFPVTRPACTRCGKVTVVRCHGSSGQGPN
ncbi:hypothetical protein BJF79_48720 [Actinomadura sp. CNU-125]|uniref:hypothetical protein n=1 Tax=Actinomadura sp. CNU-125 TaxID=1904961 RepID=UPI000958F008|nr:hypothetical protein [Actinomadura sp. CNU-125]OLT16918.1 hypothetical protein BJF79_48720 [Actinomadura sp. CNU-125]